MSMQPTGRYACPEPAWLAGGRIPSLDGLRALAILLVLFSHAHFPLDGWMPVAAVKGRGGFLGVQLFFVLSGFLITTLMLREIDRTGRLSLRAFYLRRALRILPAYVCYLAVLALLQWGGALRLRGLDWLAAATYTVNFLPSYPESISHVWSLSVEEHFYLLWPPLVAACTAVTCRRLAVGCMAVALAARWGFLLFSPGRNAIDLWTFTRLDDIAAGCLLAYLARDPGWRGRLDAAVATPARLAALLMVFLAAQLCFSRVVGARLFAPTPLALALGLANDVNVLTIALLMWAALRRPGGSCGRLLNHPAAALVGAMSYSLYLWHALFFTPSSPLSWFPANLVGTFAAAAVSYYLIERPFLAIKDRVGAAPPPRLPAPVDQPRPAPTLTLTPVEV
jgi:peptidoglycan/LPS O-acetylase OafA/YrhL